MTASKLSRFWTLITILLIAIIIIGGLVAWSRYRPSQPIEISIAPHQEPQENIYISGAVTNPGLYPLEANDTIEALIQAAGGTTASADLSGLELRIHIPEVGEEQQPQRIDINQAEAWLLEALPQIGPTLAQRIVDYREQNGPFLNTYELTNVEGIGPTTYERIKHLITVAD